MNTIPAKTTYQTGFRAQAFDENGTPYYKSNKGAKIGAVMAVPAIGFNLLPLTKNYEEKLLKYYKEDAAARLREHLPKVKKWAIPYALIAGGLTFASGAMFDVVRNHLAKKYASDLDAGYFERINSDKSGKVEWTAGGKPYYRTKIACAYGGAAGGVCAAVHALKLEKINKIKILHGEIGDSGAALLDLIFAFPAAIPFVVGGIVLAALAQKSSNKAAEKSTYINA